MPRLRFDFPDHTGTPVARTFERPVEVLCATSLDEVVPALHAAGQAAEAGRWVAGFLSYEAAPALDAAMRTHAPGHLPLLWLGVFDDVREVEATHPVVPEVPLDWRAMTTPTEYDAAFARIRDALLAGESYQVNYTTRLHALLPETFDATAAYHALRHAQGRGWHADLDMGHARILSASPELFFQLRGGTITTRPMKGTHARGRWLEEDDELARALVASAKERAENLMIVDLLRSDIGRIARPGTVRVPHLFEVERYPTVHQMTSTVTGELREGIGLVDVFRALFPCGSVTGAPKIQTMKLIRAVETSPRGVYCGAIGMIEPGGDCTFSVPIRTICIDEVSSPRRAEYGVGSGITIDATPEREAAEMREKSAVLVGRPRGFALIETMRLDAGGIPRLERHLARLARSCARFGWTFPEEVVRARLAVIRAEPNAAVRRVRLTLDEHGNVTLDVACMDDELAIRDVLPDPDELGTDLVPLSVEGAEQRGNQAEASAGVRQVALAPGMVRSTDVFRFHKTTLRDDIECARATAESLGCFDVILGNEHGEATELTRGNLVASIDGTLVTPPLTAGLLPGCLREELLERGRVHERRIPLDDLSRAERLWFVNSLRGVIEVTIAREQTGEPRSLSLPSAEPSLA